MKRSEINAMMRQTVQFLEERCFHLPPFAFWSPEEWHTKGSETSEIKNNMLGWDITDFGLGDFHKYGLILFTIRNGNPSDPHNIKPYCEKILIVEENQVTPMHFHWSKVEDIINRGGGNLLVEVHNATEEEQLHSTPVRVSVDGTLREVPTGTVMTLTPGESITLTQHMYHQFWGEPGKGKVLVGEVSAINDDKADNRFLEKLPRFPGIEEDEEPLYLLCTEYPE
jgi:D-lyxose ketol-isomerase